MSDPSVVSWAFAALCLLYLAGIASYLTIRRRSDQLPAAANFILGFFCAVAAGFCAFFFTGTLGLNFQVPGTNANGSAAGGIAVFVLVLLLWLRAAPRAVNITVRGDETLQAIDRVLTDLEHVWKGVVQIERGQTPSPRVRHRLKGNGAQAALVFSEVGRPEPLEVLTAEEVRDRLSPEEQQLLKDTEAAMAKKIKAWRREYATIRDPADANLEQKKKLLRIAAGMADDLEAIFQAIQRTLNGELQDHYSAERWIASRASGLLEQLELESYPVEREFGD